MTRGTATSQDQAEAWIAHHGFDTSIPDEANIVLYASGAGFANLQIEHKSVVLVEGDLTVEGALFDKGAMNESDHGLLLVTGTIRCHGLIWGGSPLRARGIHATGFAWVNDSMRKRDVLA